MTPEQAREFLGGRLPPALLLLGPGGWDLGAELHGDGFVVDALTAASARDVRARAQYQPLSGELVIRVQLDGAAPLAQNILLKTLEEPPDWARFILCATRSPLPTVASRCEIITLAGGAGLPADTRSKTLVCTAIRAARTGAPGLLAQAVRGWEPDQARLLRTWATEAASGRWQVFGPDSAPGVTQGQALRVLAELSRLAGSRLAPHVALDRVFCTG
jgi:DNA polymerase III, delta subunit